MEFLFECGAGDVNMGSKLVSSFKSNYNMCICNREPKERKTEGYFNSADSWELELITLELGC